MSLSRELAAAAGRHAIVTVSGVPVVFASMSGGGTTVEWEVDDSAGAPELRMGAVRYEPIVLSTPLSPYRDLEWLRRVKRRVGGGPFTVARQWTDANWAPVGAPEIYPGCVLIGVSNPESADSADDAVFTLTFATTGEAL